MSLRAWHNLLVHIPTWLSSIGREFWSLLHEVCGREQVVISDNRPQGRLKLNWNWSYNMLRYPLHILTHGRQLPNISFLRQKRVSVSGYISLLWAAVRSAAELQRRFLEDLCWRLFKGSIPERTCQSSRVCFTHFIHVQYRSDKSVGQL